MIRKAVVALSVALVTYVFAITPTTELPGGPVDNTPAALRAEQPATGPVAVHWDKVYDEQGNLIAEDVTDALDPQYIYWKDYYSLTHLQRGDKTQNPVMVNHLAMSFQNRQSVIGMDPDGSYVYEVSGTTMRRFDGNTGAYVQYALPSSGSGQCASDGQYLYVPTTTTIRKYTLTGTLVNTTTIANSPGTYGFGIARDTVWVSTAVGTWYGYACSKFNGGSLTADATWTTGVSGGTPISVAWDGTYFYMACGGGSSNAFARFYANRSLLSTGTVTGDCRGVLTVSVVPPPAPTQVSPPNTGTVATFTPTLAVSDMSGQGVDKYHFRVYQGGSVVHENNNVSANTWVTPALTNGVTYEWDCAAHNLGGWGPFSGKWSFTVAVMPGTPTLLLPDNHATDQPVSGQLEWEAASEATGYDVYLDDVNPPVDLVSSNQPGLTYDYSGLDHDKTYYWQITARNAAGVAPSAVWDFVTVVAAPESPVLVSPANHAVGQPLSGTLTWNASARATGYDVYLDDVTPPVDLVSSNQPGLTYDYSGLNYEKTYYWKVVARNIGGTNESETWDFLTESDMPEWPTGWHEAATLPTTPTAKPVKDGAWLATGPDKTDDGDVIYAAKGNKATDFYKYNPAEGENGTWYDLTAIPEMEDGKRKPPSKGTRGVAGDGAVYMTRGNNMLGFYKYVIEEDSWKRQEDIPLGDNKKKVKGGNDLVYVDDGTTGWVYLLKGQQTEFYRFNTGTNAWEKLEEAPYQAKKKYDKGSFLVYDGGSTIYAHQAKVNDGANHYMFAFDLNTMTWSQTPKKGIPVYAKEGDKTKKKKSADGAAGAWSGNNLYAMKGGNTQSFFKYTVAQDTWVELDNMPALGSTMKNKRIKAGGHLAAYGGAFFAFKGNKTHEFWRYVQPTTLMMVTRPERDGVAAGVIGNGEWRMGIEPNPIASGFATLRYSLPRPGPATVTVFDIAGRSVFSTRSPGHLTTGSLPLDLRQLSAGVYLVKLESDSFSQTQKLVVQK